MGKGGDTVQNQTTITKVTTSSSFNPSLIVGSASPVKVDDTGRDSVTELLSLGNTPTGPSPTGEPGPAPTLTKTTVLLMVAAGVIFYAKR